MKVKAHTTRDTHLVPAVEPAVRRGEELGVAEQRGAAHRHRAHLQLDQQPRLHHHKHTITRTLGATYILTPT